MHLRILVVDDDPLCLLVVTKQLERCKHQGAPPGSQRLRASARRTFAALHGELAPPETSPAPLLYECGVRACEPGLTRSAARAVAVQ